MDLPAISADQNEFQQKPTKGRPQPVFSSLAPECETEASVVGLEFRPPVQSTIRIVALPMKKKFVPPVVGWREWVSLPSLGVKKIKAKIDTGARTSALHAFEVERFAKSDATDWVRFSIYPIRGDRQTKTRVEAPLHDLRNVKSSNGKSEERPVIIATLELLGKQWPIELTLTNRDEMGFRLLLGRQAIRRKVLVDVSRSFLSGTKKEDKP